MAVIISAFNTDAMGVHLLIGAITYDIFGSGRHQKTCLTVQDVGKHLLGREHGINITGKSDARL
jgi:hypothetical protein